MILVERRLTAATRHRAEGRSENALAIYQEILDMSPANVEALQGLGEVLLELGRVEEAARIAAQVVSVAPSDIRTLALQAVAARAMGDVAGEALALEQAAVLDPLHPATACMRAEKARNAGELAAGERILVDALRQHPENTTLLNALSQTYMVAGLLGDALELSLKAVKIEPNSTAHLILLGSQLSAVGHHGQALEHFEQASLLDPANILPMIFMADAHGALGQLTEGLRIVRRAIALRPEQLAARRIQARIRIQQGEVAEAIGELAETARRHPDKIEALIAVGDAYRQAGEHAQALHLIEPLIGRNASLSLQHRQAVLAIVRESRLSLGMIDEATSLMREMGLGGLSNSEKDKSGTASGEAGQTRIDSLSVSDQRPFKSMPLLIGEHMSMLEALPLLRFRIAQDADLPLRGPAAFAELAALLPNTDFQPVEGARPIPGVDGFPLTAILALPAEVRGPVEMSAPYVVAPQDRRIFWRDSLAPLPRPWVAIAWNAGRPGLVLEDLLPLFGAFSGSLISTMWDEGRHQLADAPDVIDAGVHFEDLADLAALLAEVDALVGPDGLALHVAGAMQKRGAVLVQPNAPWYWSERDGNALWYPSISVLKSGALGHWAHRSDDLKAGLTEFLSDLPIAGRDMQTAGLPAGESLPRPVEGVI